MELKILIILHILGACVWAGGHLVLAITILPRAWKDRNPEVIRNFETPYERIGMPSLIIQVITGLRLAWLYLPDAGEWFNFGSTLSRHIGLKLLLLIITLILAIHARLFIIPNLKPEYIGVLGVHIIAITVIANLFVLTGASFRLGLFF